MCGFKPGDEVVCVEAAGPLATAKTYTVAEVVTPGDWVTSHFGDPRTVSEVVVQLCEVGRFTGPGIYGFKATRFRKVERRNDSLSIEAFLTIKPGYEEPRRAPAKKRERVQ